MWVGLSVISFVILWINGWILNAQEKSWTIKYKNATHISYNNVDIHYDAIAQLMRIALENAKDSNADDRINNIFQVFGDLDVRRRLPGKDQTDDILQKLDQSLAIAKAEKEQLDELIEKTRRALLPPDDTGSDDIIDEIEEALKSAIEQQQQVTQLFNIIEAEINDQTRPSEIQNKMEKVTQISQQLTSLQTDLNGLLQLCDEQKKEVNSKFAKCKKKMITYKTKPDGVACFDNLPSVTTIVSYEENTKQLCVKIHQWVEHKISKTVSQCKGGTEFSFEEMFDFINLLVRIRKHKLMPNTPDIESNKEQMDVWIMTREESRINQEIDQKNGINIQHLQMLYTIRKYQWVVSHAWEFNNYLKIYYYLASCISNNQIKWGHIIFERVNPSQNDGIFSASFTCELETNNINQCSVIIFNSESKLSNQELKPDCKWVLESNVKWIYILKSETLLKEFKNLQLKGNMRLTELNNHKSNSIPLYALMEFVEWAKFDHEKTFINMDLDHAINMEHIEPQLLQDQDQTIQIYVTPNLDAYGMKFCLEKSIENDNLLFEQYILKYNS